REAQLARDAQSQPQMRTPPKRPAAEEPAGLQAGCRRLSLKDFVIVDSAEIGFGAGFTVLTGETGAGKSILLDALGLALGARGDATMVRDGAARADISAEFVIDS